MTWVERERGWVAAPNGTVKALAKNGFEECKREMTRRPAPPGRASRRARER
jgi:hypothetical protein